MNNNINNNGNQNTPNQGAYRPTPPVYGQAPYPQGKPPKKKNTWIIPVVLVAVLSALVIGAVFAIPAIQDYIEERSDEEVSKSTAKKKAAKAGKADTDKKTAKEKNDKDSENEEPSEEKEEEENKAEQHPAPVFTMVTASSVRGTDTQGGQYSEWSVLTDDPMTKWVPTKSVPNGIGEWIQISADGNQYVSGLNILNGYHKNSETWQKNNRVEKCTLTFSNGYMQQITLPDTMAMINVKLDEPQETQYVRITIDSVYPGTTWNDTAITYIGAY